MTDPDQKPAPRRGDDDLNALGAQHPYLLYIGIVAGLFLFLILMAFLAVSNGWLPDRGVGR